MRLRLFLILLLASVFGGATASAATIVGVVVNGNSGSPLSGATVMLRDGDTSATSNFNGQFRLQCDDNADAYLIVMCDGYQSFGSDIAIGAGTVNMGEIRLMPVDDATIYYGDAEDLIFDETILDDDEGGSQSVAALTGANDNIYYNTASYNFGPMYFRYRGMDNQYQSVYINGILPNES